MDAIVEDPVGPSHFDPEGAGHRGRDAISAFWDKAIAHNESIEFLFEDSFACGNEVAYTGKVRSHAGGQVIDAVGVFIYKVDESGKILAVRAFWESERTMATMRPARSHRKRIRAVRSFGSGGRPGTQLLRVPDRPDATDSVVGDVEGVDRDDGVVELRH